MQNCIQSSNQNVHEHGISVKTHFHQVLNFIFYNQELSNWRVPKWLVIYQNYLKDKLLPIEIIDEYLEFHDCGKPYCLIIDSEGKKHFPDHANKSYQIWTEIVGNEQVAKLMKMDMWIHKLKSEEVNEFCSHKEAITLLLAGLSEIYSNSKMFGGIESDSFKIKWKKIDKNGKLICQKIFGEINAVD